MTMTSKQAEKLVLELIDKAIQKVAVDANLHDKYSVNNPSAVNASKRRMELRELRQYLIEQFKSKQSRMF